MVWLKEIKKCTHITDASIVEYTENILLEIYATMNKLL